MAIFSHTERRPLSSSSQRGGSSDDHRRKETSGSSLFARITGNKNYDKLKKSPLPPLERRKNLAAQMEDSEMLMEKLTEIPESMEFTTSLNENSQEVHKELNENYRIGSTVNIENIAAPKEFSPKDSNILPSSDTPLERRKSINNQFSHTDNDIVRKSAEDNHKVFLSGGLFHQPDETKHNLLENIHGFVDDNEIEKPETKIEEGKAKISPPVEINQPDLINTHVMSSVYEKDVQQRQKFIDKILLELDSKSSAIQLLGKDIVHLRETNKLQAEEISVMKKLLEESNLKTKRLISGFDLEALEAPELRRRYGLLASKLEKTLDIQRTLEKNIDELQNELESKMRIEKELKQVRMAHFAQQALLISLQETASQIGKYKDVIKKQEIVIKKQEEVIMQSKEKKPDTPNEESNLYKLLIKENRELKNRVTMLESIKSVTKFNDKDGTVPSPDKTSIEFRTMLRAEKAEARVRALEEELIECSRRFGKIIKELKMQKYFI